MVRHTLSCCLVVRNESDKIERCLNNLTILADEIVVVDTGSTDGTCAIIRKWVVKHKAGNNVKIIEVGNRFHDSDGDFDFGSAKTFAFQNATREYVMWLDANDTVSNQKKVKEIFIKETAKNPKVYFTLPTEMASKFAFIRARIAPRTNSWMEGRIHEYLKVNDPEIKKVFIPVPILNKKKGRDLPRNLRQLLKEWDRSKSGRIAFYLAQTYREMGNMQEALYWFRRRVYGFEYTEEFWEEQFKAFESIAELIADNPGLDKVDPHDLLDVANELIKMAPKRIEGHYYLAIYYTQQQKFTEAIDTFKKCASCERPKEYKLWLNPKLYNGQSVKRQIEQCEYAIKYSKPLQPQEIINYGPTGGGTYTKGNAQYR